MGRQPPNVKHLVRKLGRVSGGPRLRELSKQARAKVTADLCEIQHPSVLQALQREIRQLSKTACDADGLVTKMAKVVERTLEEGLKEMMGVLLTGQLIRDKKKIRKLEAEVLDLSAQLMAERAAHRDLKLRSEFGQ